MAFRKFFIRPSLMFRGGSRIFVPFCQCWALHILLSDLQIFPLRPVSLQVMQSLCSAVPFTHTHTHTHTHTKTSNTSYIPVADPSTETLPSGHHKNASHTCCIQDYSAAALGFRRFLSCGQRVWLEWMDVGFHYAAIVVILAGHVWFRGHSSDHLYRSRTQGHLPFWRRHQLLMMTAKRRNSDIFLEKILSFKSWSQ